MLKIEGQLGVKDATTGVELFLTEESRKELIANLGLKEYIRDVVDEKLPDALQERLDDFESRVQEIVRDDIEYLRDDIRSDIESEVSEAMDQVATDLTAAGGYISDMIYTDIESRNYLKADEIRSMIDGRSESKIKETVDQIWTDNFQNYCENLIHDQQFAVRLFIKAMTCLVLARDAIVPRKPVADQIGDLNGDTKGS